MLSHEGRLIGMAASVPDVPLNNGVMIPQLGFGVFQVPNEATGAPSAPRSSAATEASTPPVYGNEAGSARHSPTSGVPRDELFVTTKLWNDDQGYDATSRVRRSLRRLRPRPRGPLPDPLAACPRRDSYVDTWHAFEKLYADGRARAIGVSNFQAAHLQRLLDRPASCPPSTRSSSTPTSSRRSCARSTPAAASSPRPGARSGRAGCSATRSRRAGRRHGLTPPRSCSAGTCSSATS